MQISTQTFHVPKRGGTDSEYEDAFYPEGKFQGELSAWRCAVADGATESAFSREWAQLLVQSFGRHEFRLKEQQRLWASTVNQNQLPWYLESKLSRGAHAAFIGLSLRDPPTVAVGDDPRKGTWRAFAIGDSCVFHVRNNELLTVGPLSRSEEFGNSPLLLSTTLDSPISHHNPLVSVISGTWESNDIFYLATDALSQWLLAQEEVGRPAWSFLQCLDPSAFAPVISVLRISQRLHNDDTTLLRLEVR